VAGTLLVCPMINAFDDSFSLDALWYSAAPLKAAALRNNVLSGHLPHVPQIWDQLVH